MRSACIILLLLILPGLVSAHGPSRQKIVKEININASPEIVWGLISDFCSIADWNPAVTACAADKADQPGTIRTITLESGQALREKLIKKVPDMMRISYRLIEANVEAIPINTLGSSLTVIAVDDGTTNLEYKAAFYRSFPGLDPPPELSDAAAAKAIGELYEAGFNHLKQLAEQ